MKKVREVLLFIFLICLEFQLKSVHGNESVSLNCGTVGRLVKKDQRRTLISTEFGSISTVDIEDGMGRNNNYHLQFITMEPNSLFLPVLLHADMLLFVHTGSGRLSWIDNDKDKVKSIELQRGDLYRLRSGALFYLYSSLEPQRPRLRIISIFATSEDDENELHFKDPSIGPYSSIKDLVRGFDTKVLQAAFQVPEEVVEEITKATDMPAIVHAETGTTKNNFWDENAPFINAFLSIRRYNIEAAYENKKKQHKAFNFYNQHPDVKNCHGWSTVVTKHDLHALKGSHIGSFMVNLTKGSMMGPHWNPKATEVSVVLEGEGMVRIVCPSTLTSKDCKHTRFRVEEGDVFVVPRFHPMAQTAFNNESLAFVGFSSAVKKNHPQFLAGKASVLQTIDRFILAASFGVSNETIDKLLAAQKQSIILDCTSCAEEEEMMMEKEIEEAREKEEEKRRKEEEERRREEEERKRHEEEEKKQEEEEEKERQRKEEEEEKRRREEEEERERQQEEEEKRRKEEEEERERQQEEEEKRRREEEERRRREEEEERERQQEEEEKRRKEEEEERERQQEEEEKRRREEEERRRREEEEERERQQEEEEKRRKEEEEERERQQEEEEKRRREEEERREREEERQREEDERRQQEEAREREEEERRQREEEMQREEEERRRWEEAREREEEERRRREREGREEQEEREEETEEEAARREEQERVEREREEDEAARRRRYGGIDHDGIIMFAKGKKPYGEANMKRDDKKGVS